MLNLRHDLMPLLLRVLRVSTFQCFWRQIIHNFQQFHHLFICLRLFLFVYDLSLLCSQKEIFGALKRLHVLVTLNGRIVELVFHRKLQICWDGV